MVPQYTLENVLLERVQALPNVSVRFNCRLETTEQSPSEVRSEVVDVVSGERATIRSSYMVGADGVHSRVRNLIGVKMEGKHDLARFVNLIFYAPDLAASHPFGKAIHYWFVNRDLPIIIGPMDDGRRGQMVSRRSDHPQRPGCRTHGRKRDPPDRSWCRGRNRSSRHGPVDVEFAHCRLVSRQRIFLAGDACHTHPPFGGFGMNMGIGDAVDLGWKLAATLQGWGGAELLDAYESERRPVHLVVLNEAVANQAILGNSLVRDEIDAEDPKASGSAPKPAERSSPRNVASSIRSAWCSDIITTVRRCSSATARPLPPPITQRTSRRHAPDA